jgi:uncharacterized protein YjbI with pentapeptide repeats
MADLSGANLVGTHFENSELSGANLTGANLSGAILYNASLSVTNLTNANLTKASFHNADLIGTNFHGANLHSASLRYSNLYDANLFGASLENARMQGTLLSRLDLSATLGLETVRHEGPSTVGIDTIFKSKGKIPEVFLRGCGVPEALITYVPSLVGAVEPIQFYSVFISYSSKDQSFAERLHADLQSKRVRCWFAPEDLKIGDKFRETIDEKIRVYDKLLVVLSKHSVGSDWVEKEVETAMERERKHKRTMLFPIRLDKAVMKLETGWPADMRRTRNIGDFQKWKNHDAYQKAFDRLMHDLKADEKKAA